jgi:hypothetical protein
MQGLEPEPEPGTLWNRLKFGTGTGTGTQTRRQIGTRTGTGTEMNSYGSISVPKGSFRFQNCHILSFLCHTNTFFEDCNFEHFKVSNTPLQYFGRVVPAYLESRLAGCMCSSKLVKCEI